MSGVNAVVLARVSIAVSCSSGEGLLELCMAATRPSFGFAPMCSFCRADNEAGEMFPPERMWLCHRAHMAMDKRLSWNCGLQGHHDTSMKVQHAHATHEPRLT